MSKADQKIVAVCVHERPLQKACHGQGLVNTLEREIRRRGLAARVEPIRCFGQCAKGPNVKLIPAGKFLHAVCEEDLHSILRALEDQE